MLLRKNNTNRGLIKMIIVIIVALLIISYLGLNLREIASSPTSQSNFQFVGEQIAYVWNTFLKAPVVYVWHFLLNLIWHAASDGVQKAIQGTASSTVGL